MLNVVFRLSHGLCGLEFLDRSLDEEYYRRIIGNRDFRKRVVTGFLPPLERPWRGVGLRVLNIIV
jgi:hypothetical protein